RVAMALVTSGGTAREVVEGSTLFECADQLGIRVPTSCNRQGTCHECIVEVPSGMNGLRARTEAESFLRDRYRLACQAVLADGAEEIEFAPLSRRPKILTSSAISETEIDPLVTRSNGDVFYDGVRIDEDRGRICGLAVD